VREVRRTERTVTNKDQLTLALAVAGGAAVILEPLAASAP
jgi:alpha-glucosidase